MRAELHGTLRAGWRELHDPKAVVEGEVSVEPPAEAGVERLGAIGVSHRDDDRLELEINQSALKRSTGCALSIDGAHLALLCLVPDALSHPCERHSPETSFGLGFDVVPAYGGPSPPSP